MSKGGNLGKANLVLGTQDAGLISGLSAAKGRIGGWAGGLKTALNGALAYAGAKIGAFSAQSLAGGLGDLAGVGKQAKNLGIASDVFMGLGVAARGAGVEQEQLGEIMAKAQGKIAGGSEEVGAALGRMGLSFADLQGKSPDAQFFAIAKGLEGVKDQGQKAFIAQKLFEEQGVKLLPVLAKGEKGLKDFIEQQKKVGTAVGAEDMAKVQRAQASITAIKQRSEGIWNKILVTAAPLVEGFGSVVLRVFDRLQPAIDWAQRLAGTFTDVAGPAIVAVFDVAMEFVDSIASGLGDLFGPLTKDAPSAESVVVAVLRGIGIAGAYVWDTFKAGLGAIAVGGSYVRSVFLELWSVLNEVRKAGADLLPDDLGGKQVQALVAGERAVIDHLQKMNLQSREWGMKQINAFGQTAAGTRAWFDGEKWKKPKEDAKPITDAIAAAFKYQANPAIEKGSKEDYSARVQWEQGRQKDADKMFAEQVKANVNLQQIVNGVNKIPAALNSISSVLLGTV